MLSSRSWSGHSDMGKLALTGGYTQYFWYRGPNLDDLLTLGVTLDRPRTSPG
jgi:hypothetical protein